MQRRSMRKSKEMKWGKPFAMRRSKERDDVVDYVTRMTDHPNYFTTAL
jgi:hypothetical protein